MKVISYSLFNGKKERFEKMAYIRGFYFNVRMNRLIYPEWRTHLSVDYATYYEYKNFFESLDVVVEMVPHTPELCEGMLWRMRPIWMPFVSHVICRDADAITTYREAQLVNIWELSDKGSLAILDNPAHAGLMGGMVGFKTDVIKKHFTYWGEMLTGAELSKHGSDQNLLNSKVLPKIKDTVLWSNATGLDGKSWPKVPKVDPKLWESNLTCRHIGSAGVVEMEILRFFKRFDKTDYSEFEKEHSDICYWAR